MGQHEEEIEIWNERDKSYLLIPSAYRRQVREIVRQRDEGEINAALANARLRQVWEKMFAA